MNVRAGDDIERVKEALTLIADFGHEMDDYDLPPKQARKIARDALAALDRLQGRLATAEAVAKVWTAGLMQSDNGALRAGAHAVAMVRGALAGETDPVQLGCDAEELALALAHPEDFEAFRAALESLP